jgi:hypothetical protein
VEASRGVADSPRGADRHSVRSRGVLWSGSAGRYISLTGLALAVLFGLVARLWLLHSQPLNSDEAVVGLMAEQIRHGHFYAFYWGQQYGGVEPYVAAVVTSIAGDSPLVLNFVPTLLWAFACIVIWRVGRYMLPDGWRLAPVAVAVAMWTASPVAYISTTRELGFRGITVLLGVSLVWGSLRAGRSPTLVNFFLVGLIAGIGWWSSPEIAYFVVPAAGALITVAFRTARWRVVLPAVVAGGLLGSAPWVVTNLRTGFGSLDIGSSPGYGQVGYGGRLDIFFTKSFPLELGLRNMPTMRWLFDGLGLAIYLFVIVVVIGLCVGALLSRFDTPCRTATRFIGAQVLLFPFEYAILPATRYWEDGRYAIYLVPQLALLAMAALPLAGRWLRSARPLRPILQPFSAPGGGLWFGAVSAVSICAFTSSFLHDHPTKIFDRWGNPDAAVQQSVDTLERSGVRFAFADYWTAYTVDYISRGDLDIVPTYSIRWPAQSEEVAHQPEVSLLFFSPDEYALAHAELGGAPGPKGFTEATFLASLRDGHFGYRVVWAGVLDAVVVSPRARSAA